MDHGRKPQMMIIRRYKKSRSGKSYWEYKIRFKDVYTNKVKTRRRGGFATRQEAIAAATEMMGYLNLPMIEIVTKG